MAFKPTKEQKSAIDTKGNVLVSAAAGSGKTAVLVERVISRLTDKQSPVSADRLLIVTFTNAAAAEMRTRIEKRLDEECRKNPDDIGLLLQRHLLSGAKICTIDSFCIDLVRENFEKLNISPDFKISDGYTLKSTDENVLFEIINNRLESNDAVFEQLLDIVGAEYDEGNFSEFVLRLFNYSRQLPFPKKWFDSIADTYRDGEFKKGSVWYNYAFERAKESVLDIKNQLSTAIDLAVTVEKAANAYLETFSFAAAQAEMLYEAALSDDWDTFYNALSGFDLPSLPTVRGLSGYYEVTAAKEIYKNIQTKATESLNKLFCADREFINAQFAFLSGPMCLLAEILTEFDTKLFDEYNRQNTFTFHNAEHLALQLLCDENGNVKSGAEEFLDRFDEVMVDEYQDTNDLQDMLFYVLSDRERKLFVVGDVKQSIYGFRGANPINFLNKKNRYLPLESADKNAPKKIILGKNFRCKPQVCDFVNFFFESFMNKKTGEIIYNSEEMLIPEAVYPETDKICVSFDIIDCASSEEKSSVLEAGRIAEYIKEVMSDGECIRVNDTTLRRARFSDFAILLRNTKDKAPTLASMLRSYGIPVNYSAEGYAESIEISTFLALLKVIDNPKNDVELLTVMLSPIFGFTPDEMSVLRVNKRSGDLYSAVIFAKEQGNGKIKTFLEAIERYRLLAVTLPLEKLVSRLLYETEYLNIVSSMTDGNRQRNNLLLLCDYASQYAGSGGGGIDSFVKYIIRNSESGMKSATVNSGSDAVRIMSIHASKGLQFPVCIVAGTVNPFNDSDARSNALYSTEYGLGLKYFDEALKKRITTVGREVILSNLQRSRLEEELRLLYVAMTRTQDKLLFVSSFTNLEKRTEKYKTMLISAGSEISSSLFLSTRSYADWLMICLLLHPDGKVLRGNGSCIIPKQTDSRINVSVIDGGDIKMPDTAIDDENYVADEIISDEISNNIAYKYPFEELLEIESKSSVSAIANKAESEKYAFSGQPAFMSEGGITATQRGTAMHRVMEFFDFEKSDNIEEELERLYEWQYITETEKNSVSRRGLKSFFESDLFARIKNSTLVKREMRFLTEVPAREIRTSLDKRFEEENIIIQGAVDVCFEEDGEIVVLDFKTDHTDRPESLVEAYGEQLSIYALACEKIFGKPVKEKIIYSFVLSRAISLKS